VRRGASTAGLISLAVALVLLTILVVGGSADDLDARLLPAIATWIRGHDGLMRIMYCATTVGDSSVRFPIAGVAALLLLIVRQRRGALFLLIAMPGAWLTSSIFKLIVERPRPSLLPRLDVVTTHSYPSGHAWSGMVLCLALALVLRPAVPSRFRLPLLGVALFGAFLIGVSRLALAVHWPSDVLAGWIGGALWVAICARWLSPSLLALDNPASKREPLRQQGE
jgi:undecaprenyl-diphosphatase